MFDSPELKTHFETSPTVRLQSLVLAEWNMNMPDNIFKIGNYRYRPTTNESLYHTLPSSFDQLDAGGYYTGATDDKITIDGGFKDDDTPQTFTSSKDKMKMVYSLEDCLKPFRPRSGINKASYFNTKYLANSSADMAQRPRYYMASRYDQFKYWTSYRTEDGIERGIAKTVSNSLNFIDDAVPFVVYKDSVPANRIIVKMQTNVGSKNLGPFKNQSASITDPLYGDSNRTTPTRWKIEYLRDNTWTTAYSFNENSVKEDGTQVIGSDGYIELSYGLIIPEVYRDNFLFAETFSSASLLPSESINGYAYLVIENTGDLGTIYIWNSSISDYDSFSPNYGWQLSSEAINNQTPFVTDLTSPASFNGQPEGISLTKFREFSYLRGLRVVVESMNKFDSTFDLIEMSPRLCVNISEKAIDFSITKSLSDLGDTSLPVGQLLASAGKLNLFDDDQAFNENNTSSIIYKYIRKNIKFNFYESIVGVENYDYYVPIKTLYSEGVPQADVTGATISIDLRDFYFFLESMPAPSLLTTQTSLSFAITTLLDYIGFSNYVFKRVSGESEPIIPYFFIAPDQNVAEVLNQLAVSTQTAMFFDEYNNFIVMSKDYLMPTETQRSTDIILSGSNNQSVSGAYKNATSGNLPNILSITSQDKKIYNDGNINYTTRYIQRSYGSVRQADKVDQDKTWIYKSSPLWEVSGTGDLKTINEVASTGSSYSLSAMPLNSNLSNQIPTVSNGVVVNNIIDLGENIYWLTKYQGYVYSNGEIIKYDAAQFNITIAIWYPILSNGINLDESKPEIVLPGRLAPSSVIDNLDKKVSNGEITEAQKSKEIQAWRVSHRQGSSNVWIKNNQEYQNYFSSLPFNGKIYPTGLLRIYSTPYYETIDGIARLQSGAVVDHGRAQFGTIVTSHTAGTAPYWSDNSYVRGCNMQSQYLFTTELDPTVPASVPGAAGISNDLAKQTTRNGVIKNLMTSNFLTETQTNNLKSTQTGTVQASALIMNGPSFKTSDTPLNFVSYVYKSLDNAYKHFGTRMRIVGKIENNTNKTQAPVGKSTYFQISGSQPDQPGTIGGGSGGLAVLLNPETNNGYYFEIIALTETNIGAYLKTNTKGESEFSINNIVFYKIQKDATNSNAIPVKLWGGLSKILVDDGKFTGQYRITGEENPTVYDLAVEYEDIGKIRRFYLYVNNKLIRTVDDPSPLPIYNNMAIFTRGSSRVMFENVYALSQNYSQNTVSTVGETVSQAFGDNKIDASESFRKYAMSGVVQSSYLTGISSTNPPKYNMYFEEFGSIMRECAYFDIRYDRAYPALYSKISPTFNRIKGYSVSGFQADSYGAEFLIFNSTDMILNLDETSGNFLTIQGIAFTQDTTHKFTVDEYFKKRGNLSDPELKGSTLVRSPLIEKAKYDEIRQSRMVYGKNEFSIDGVYIQTQDDAEALMGWIINKTMHPKKSIGLNIFSIPTIQLGDIVTVNYKNKDGLDLVTSDDTRFVVYNIEYSRNDSGPNMSIYLSEV